MQLPKQQQPQKKKKSCTFMYGQTLTVYPDHFPQKRWQTKKRSDSKLTVFIRGIE